MTKEEWAELRHLAHRARTLRAPLSPDHGAMHSTWRVRHHCVMRSERTAADGDDEAGGIPVPESPYWNPTYPAQSRRIPPIPASRESHLSQRIPLIPANPAKNGTRPAPGWPAFLTRVMVCAALSGRQGRNGAQRDAGTSGKCRDADCRPESAALRVAPRRPPAASRTSTVFPDTLLGPLLADRAPGLDAGRNLGEKP